MDSQAPKARRESKLGTLHDGELAGPTPQTPQKIGRYTILRELGRGGMGVVYDAYDQELDRRLAIKLLRRVDATASRRLKREAQAMAQLSHPNVAQIYEVGTHAREFYVAMELIDGATLGRWVRTTKPSIDDILAVMTQAAHGLAAAHAAGLVHRDFKPDNVLVGADGRVRVLDFGLAGYEGESMASGTFEGVPPIQPRADESLSAKITVTGALLGTPAYMSPEQFQRERPGPRSDQWSFCVTLYEALYGERPFDGTTSTELADAVLGGRPRAAPEGSAVPAWLRAAIFRGLAIDPDDRYDDMPALVAGLRRNPTRRRRLAIVASVAAALAVGGVLWHRASVAAKIARCDDLAARISVTWNDHAKQQMASTMRRDARTSAANVFDKTVPWLDSYAEAWARGRRASCLNSNVDERADDCYALRHAELAALVALLSEGKPAANDTAVQAAADLPDVAACSNAMHLALSPEIPNAQHARVLDLRVRLSAAAARLSTGDAEGASIDAEPLERQATALGYGPLLASARILLGRIAETRGHFDSANEVLERAYFGATETDDAAVAAEAAIALVRVATHRAEYETARTWGRRADTWHGRMNLPASDLRRMDLVYTLAAVDQSSGQLDAAATGFESVVHSYERELGPDHPSTANAVAGLALVHAERGHYERAKELLLQAIASLERALGPEHPSVALTLGRLAEVYSDAGDLAEAVSLNERVLALTEAALGRDHIAVGDALNALGMVRFKQGEYSESERLLDRALRIREGVHGEDHPDVIGTMSNLGAVYFSTGEYAKAGRIFGRTVEIREAIVGPDAPEMAGSLSNLGVVKWHSGDAEGAEVAFRRALAIELSHVGPDHPQVGSLHQNLGGLLLEADKIDAARAEYERAFAIFDAALRPDDPRIVTSMDFLAMCAWRDGRHDDAVDVATRALAIAEQAGTSSDRTASVRFTLARALWSVGEQRPRALAMAQQARAEAHAINANDRLLVLIDAWLASR